MSESNIFTLDLDQALHALLMKRIAATEKAQAVAQTAAIVAQQTQQTAGELERALLDIFFMLLGQNSRNPESIERYQIEMKPGGGYLLSLQLPTPPAPVVNVPAVVEPTRIIENKPYCMCGHARHPAGQCNGLGDLEDICRCGQSSVFTEVLGEALREVEEERANGRRHPADAI